MAELQDETSSESLANDCHRYFLYCVYVYILIYVYTMGPPETYIFRGVYGK